MGSVTASDTTTSDAASKGPLDDVEVYTVDRVEVYTVGHSNISTEAFVALLNTASIDVVADVRSAPVSRFCPWFDETRLRSDLAAESIGYVSLGDQLGGRPRPAQFYDADGHVLYDLVAETDWFRAGVNRLISGARKYRVAIMCSEAAPHHCHRRLLVGRVLADRGVGVTHLLSDGTQVREETLAAAVAPSLFADFGWRSHAPVRPPRQ